ncbi:aminoacetone oxidase family FAD-binding enzyme, partial [candidate division WOR-3 bacterium]|nr:aminoacetone oxidase family FAD-binding enzyme [candidate division WOR-3 bacterium]
MIYDVIIIGAGAAGLFTAANIRGGSVLLLEKNERAGIKLVISGGGKCNFTNMLETNDMIEHYFDKKHFVKPAIFNFSPNDLIKYFNKKKLKTVTDEEGRVFPESMSSVDVLNLILNQCIKNKVKIIYSSPVISIRKANNRFFIQSEKGFYESKYTVITTGGRSYPSTGSEGDGYRFAKAFGHKIINPEAALTPIKVKNGFEKLSGITVKRKRISVYREGEKIAETTGDILFTHTGLSGPAVLNLSRMIKAGDIIVVSLTNFKNMESLLFDIKCKIAENGKKSVVNIIRLYDIPYKMAKNVLKSSGVEYRERAGDMTRVEIRKVVENLFPEYQVERKYGFKKAML